MVSSRLQQRTLGQFAQSECGQSLVLAMIVMSALTISIGALISLTTGNEHQFGRDLESARAFHVAEAGVNDGLSLIVTNDDNDGRLRRHDARPVRVTLDGASGSYSLTKYAKTDTECLQTAGAVASCWVITGTATSPNGAITRTITETAYWLPRAAASGDVELRPRRRQPGRRVCRHARHRQLHDQGRLDQRRLLPLGQRQPDPARGTHGLGVHRRRLPGKNNTSIGTSSLPYASVDIVGGCTVQGSPQICSDSANSGVWSDGPPASTPPDFSIPVIDAPGDVRKGQLAFAGCSHGLVHLRQRHDGERHHADDSLMPSGASFDCTVKDSGGNPVGRPGLEQRDPAALDQRHDLDRRQPQRLEQRHLCGGQRRRRARTAGRSTSTAP